MIREMLFLHFKVFDALATNRVIAFLFILILSFWGFYLLISNQTKR